MRSKDAERLGVPFMLTEFGACMEGDGCANEIRHVLEVCDVNLTGWAYWQFKTYKDLTTSAGEQSEGFYDDKGNLIVEKVKELTRPYVRAAQGQILNMTTFANGTFSFKLKVDTSIEIDGQMAPTEFYINTDYWFKPIEGG